MPAGCNSPSSVRKARNGSVSRTETDDNTVESISTPGRTAVCYLEKLTVMF